MRPGQQNKRGRGRNNNTNNNNNNGGGNNNHNRKGSNPLTRTYDSSGPDVKIRGTAQHIAEKYATLARDAQSSGDRVVAENYLQHAEHYNRIIASAQAQMQERFQRDDRSDYNDRNDYQDRDGNERDDDMDQGDTEENLGGQDQQVEQQQRHHQQAERQQRQHRQPEGERQQDPERQAQPEGERPPRQERQRHQDRPRQPRAEQVQPRPDLAPQPVIDGSGPQPVIEGTPAEVSLEEEAPTGRARRVAALLRAPAASRAAAKPVVMRLPLRAKRVATSRLWPRLLANKPDGVPIAALVELTTKPGALRAAGFCISGRCLRA